MSLVKSYSSFPFPSLSWLYLVCSSHDTNLLPQLSVSISPLHWCLPRYSGSLRLYFNSSSGLFLSQLLSLLSNHSFGYLFTCLTCISLSPPLNYKFCDSKDMPLSIMAVMSRIKVPKDIQVLIPRTCENVMLSGKGELRLQANQMIFNREIILDYLCWPNVITWFFKRRNGKPKTRSKWHALGRFWPTVAGFENGGMGTGTGECG